MTTEKKTESNRKNARKSTGPRSAAGKAIVSQNARTHGLLSGSLIVKGESGEEFSELLRLLSEDFQPVGLVEHALVERIAISLWRQRRLVRAESAEVAINQQRFGKDQQQEIGKVLNLGYTIRDAIKAPEDRPEDDFSDEYVAQMKDERNLWKSFIEGKFADAVDPFSHLPEDLQKSILHAYEADAGQIDAVVKERFGSWAGMFEAQVDHFEFMILEKRIRDVCRLVMQSQALPSKTDLLSRYQTALDNDLYKALKALREAQAWRQAKAVISVKPMLPPGDGGRE